MDLKSRQLLEFNRILEIVAGFTGFSRSREMVLALEPSVDINEVSDALAKSAEARKLMESEPGFSLDGIKDITAFTLAAARGKVLDTLQLLDIAQAVNICSRVQAVICSRGKDLPLITCLAGRMVDLKALEKDITRAISPGGEVLSSSSPRLAQIRSELKWVREKLLRELDSIVKSEEASRALQEAIVTQREGRYVVPVRVENKKDIKGIVHDVSNTGATVFIEPWSTIDTGNELKQLELEEIREIEKILAGLSAKVGSYSEEIASNIDLVARIDLELAKARYAYSVGAFEPRISALGDDRTLKLVRARHPLLKGRAVPLDLEIGREYSTLIITGPNTGGKTVALKTIGLFCLMAQAGLPVPADSATQLPVFDGVYADIGDEQSIEQTLSSFSWHMGNISRILNLATANSLVLMDELGTSTDPVEGSALAAAIISYLFKQGTMTVATSHFNELKALAHTTTGIKNAAFEFDPVTLLPTYRIVPGVPGGSNAIITAARLGVPAYIIEAAKERLSSQDRQLDSLLFELANEQTRARNDSREAEEAKKEAEKLRLELSRELDKLKKEKENILNRARDEAVMEIGRLTLEIRDISAILRKNRSKEQLEMAKGGLEKVRRRLRETSTYQVNEPEGNAETSEIHPGDDVWLNDLAMEARVIAFNSSTGQVTAESGSLRFTVDSTSVSKVKAQGEGKEKTYTGRTRIPRQHVSMELDLRGKRADEVELELESYLDSAIGANLDSARIIHGYGTGVVRQIVRDYLSRQKLVKSFRPGENDEGGDGVTVVKLA
ncbi:MAG: endonuclease MutS2 [Dehalococcoidales bacterium]|jgi:DNA mismatch repair protein MutS2|nr:endonuclease MutS2 [Dehalococcoidales bacterium]MDD4466060.1 endonuclease MutS2 [Dehalococcoidales bacterium]MDD5402202.1 endonuclease MutS2 [Dehalococcoidales bacterium]